MSLRPPKQDRSRRTLDRLTQSAMDLMAVQGVEHTSVAQVVKAARSSVGSFYARFEAKGDFVQYLERRVWEDARERWDLATHHLDGRDLTTAELVAGVVRLLVETSQADQARRNVLGKASGSSARATAFHDHVLSDVRTALLARRGEFAHPDPSSAITLGYWIIAGALKELPSLTAEVEGLEPLVSELTRMYLAYLGSESDPPAPRFAVETRPATSGVPSEALSEATPAGTEWPLETSTDVEQPAFGEVSAGETPLTQPEPPEPEPEPEAEPERVDFFDVWG